MHERGKTIAINKEITEVFASKEAGLAQEIRGTSFEHLLLHATSVAYGHWASTTSATALGVHSPSVTPLFSFLP